MIRRLWIVVCIAWVAACGISGVLDQSFSRLRLTRHTSTTGAGKVDDSFPELSELGKKVKAKYPGAYDDLSDAELGRRVKAKYGSAPDIFDTVAAERPSDWVDVTPPLAQPGVKFVEGDKRPLHIVESEPLPGTPPGYKLDKPDYDALAKKHGGTPVESPGPWDVIAESPAQPKPLTIRERLFPFLLTFAPVIAGFAIRFVKTGSFRRVRSKRDEKSIAA